MKVTAEFVPLHLEKALDVARHVATFARIEFTADLVKMRVLDPAKVVYLELSFLPETYKCDQEFGFGVHLHMLYKLVRSLHNDQSLEIEADESIMKINQCQHYHTLVNQDVPFDVPEVKGAEGQQVQLPTKLFQKYVRALGNIAPAVEVNYVPASDTLFLESVNSMYRTLFSIDTGVSPNEGQEYRKQFMIKFLEVALNPGLADTVTVSFGHSLGIRYEQPSLTLEAVVAAYTEG